MTQHILIFSLGPVQSFIAEARRAHDLWAGSKTLSALAKAAAKEIGGQLVLPHAVDVDDMPNKIVAIVEDPTQAARNAQDAACRCWYVLAAKALENSKLSQGGDFSTIWQRQLEHHLEFAWAAAEIEGDEIAAYRQAALALDARKQTRTFDQSPEDGPKDTLSGQRSALRESIQQKAVSTYWEQAAQRHSDKLKADEWLDALGVMKRFEPYRLFPSVSTVAVSSLLEKAKGLPELLALHTALDILGVYRPKNCGFDFWPYDGDMLFEETYAPQRFKASYSQVQGDPRSALLVLKQLYKAVDTRPSSYYAIVQMDGDQMGKHLTNGCCSLQDVQMVSKRLAQFTEQVKELITPPNGYLLYAGGDDVLALLPLDSVLKVANEIARIYREVFQDWANEALPLDKNGNRIPFTLSAGVAIVHHLYPLDAALSATRAAENAAKRIYGRNAICLTVLNRSGETVQVGGRWQVDDVNGGTLGLCDAIKTHFVEHRLSSKFAYEVVAEAQAVTGLPGAGATILKRLLKRHKTDALSTTDLAYLTKTLPAWAEAHNAIVPTQTVKSNGQIQEIPQGLTELSRWLVLARFLAQGGKE